MDQQGTDAVSIFESQPQPIQLTQGKAVMVQHLGATQSVGQGQIPAQLHQINPEQQSLDLQHFALNTGQLSGNSQVEIDMNSAGISVLPTQEQHHVELPTGSVFATVPVGIPTELTTANVLPGSEVVHRLNSFWQDQLTSVNSVTDDHWKNPEFPLARIKKIMRMDEDVRMISAEVPMMFSKAVEIFISELTMRAWQHTEESKRRTIQRSDVAMAITKNDVFDFLIDIVPREEIQLKTKPNKTGEGENLQLLPPDLLQLYIQQLALNAAGEGGEGGEAGLIQHQLQTLQQLMQIQQLQEQQQQQVATGLDQSVQLQHPQVVDHQTLQQQASLSQIQGTPSSTFLEAQVLQASENHAKQATPAEINLMEQFAKTQGVNQTSHSVEQVSTGQTQVLHHINPSELFQQTHRSNTATVVIQSPMIVSSSSENTSVLDPRGQYQLQDLTEQPVIQQEIQQQLESIANQVLVQPTSNIPPFTSHDSQVQISSNTVELPAEFATSSEKQTERVKFSNIPESQSIPRFVSSPSASLSPSTNDLVAFKSTPLRLTHVHGSSSLVKLPTSVSSTPST